MRARLVALAIVAIAGGSSPALARNILITNDDGLSSNVKALYERLKAEGNDVIVSVPCTNQSGMGAAVRFMVPLRPLSTDCRNGAAKAGDPGAGPMTRAGFDRDFFYVDSTPVMATLYGLDVAAKARWGRAPDLVLSGPNEGQNVGPIVLNSGTVSNAQVAGSRGVPAIALSAGFRTVDDATLANPQSVKVAQLTARLLGVLEAGARGGALLPRGAALNVNFPDQLDGARWMVTKIGSYEGYTVRFVGDLGASAPIGPTRSLPHLPGITVDANTLPPSPTQQTDEAAANLHAVTVSPMQIGYDVHPLPREWLSQRLRALTRP